MRNLLWIGGLGLLFALHAWAGGMTGNAGDAVLQEFNLRGLQVAAYLKATPSVAQTYGIDPAQFLDTVKKTHLEAQDHLFLQGQEVDAINYPSQFRIQVSRSRWTATATRIDAYLVQRRIALHEYLWVYGIDDTGYAVSNPIVMEIEKSVGQLLDPDVRKLLFQKFCNQLTAWSYANAKDLLGWGLDLNEDCPSSMSQQQHFSPMQDILFSYDLYPKTDASEGDRMSLIKAMLQYGADPNEVGIDPNNPLIIEALTKDTDFAQLLLDFGADPNLQKDDGESVFSIAAGITGGFNMRADTFKMFIKAGGNVNLSTTQYSPAQVIVSKANNSDVVEALIQTNQTNWCKSFDPYFHKRTIDWVLPEYQPLLDQYQIKCGRFAQVMGQGKSCAAAQNDGKNLCLKQSFKIATFTPFPAPAPSGCLNQTETDGTVVFSAFFNCTDE